MGPEKERSEQKEGQVKCKPIAKNETSKYNVSDSIRRYKIEGGLTMKKENNEIQSIAHSKYRCQYQIVLAPKYRRKEIYGTIKKDSVRFELFFFSVNLYDIRLFTTFLLKIFLYLRLLIFDESAAAFNFVVPLEPHERFGFKY